MHLDFAIHYLSPTPSLSSQSHKLQKACEVLLAAVPLPKLENEW